MTRILFVSGSIGLGHATRDLAIAAELRRLRPGVRIEWLAGDPARRTIEEAGEAVLRESSAFRETGVAERRAGPFALNIIGFVARAIPAWLRSASAALAAARRRDFDVVVGDEAYELSIAFQLRPSLKRVPFAMIYDFVGLDSMTRSRSERLMVHGANRLWCGGRRGAPPSADLTVFVGAPEDVPDTPFGRGLPNRRAYARRHYRFVGYILGFDPADYADRARLRAALGYDERPLVVCSVGGTSVGRDLLDLCAAAHPHLRARVPGLRMVLVCGPRIDPASVPVPPGVEVHGYVPRLHEHFAACDVAVVQAGGTTTLELTALRRPFLYFPLEGHAEQQLVVAPRLERHRAGVRHAFAMTTPKRLADAISGALASEPAWPAIPTDGATRAAELILALARGGP